MGKAALKLGQRHPFLLILSLVALFISGCGQSKHADWYYNGQYESDPYSTYANNAGRTPSTMPVNCDSAYYVACPASMQSIVDYYFPTCPVAVRRLCDLGGRPLSSERFCVNGAQGYTANQVVSVCAQYAPAAN